MGGCYTLVSDECIIRKSKLCDELFKISSWIITIRLLESNSSGKTINIRVHIDNSLLVPTPCLGYEYENYNWSCKNDNHPHFGCENWPKSQVKGVVWSTLIESSFKVLFWGRFTRTRYSFQCKWPPGYCCQLQVQNI